MNWVEFAMARHYAQLLAESEARDLTETETGRLEVLAERVEAYEAREMRGVWNRPAAETTKVVVDDSRREPRAGRRL